MSFDTNQKNRKAGICKGEVEISDDFDKLPPELLSKFYGLDGIAYQQKLRDEWEDETSYLLSRPNNKKALLQAIDDLKNNRFIKGELIDGEFIADVIKNKI